jgi:hypothetical protein
MAVGRQVTKGKDKTEIAAADLSASTKRYTFVKMSGVKLVNTCGAGERPVGIQQNLPDIDEGCVLSVIGCGGSSLLRVGETVAAGDPLKSGTGGVAMKAASGESYYAIANEGVTFVANEIIEAILQTGTMP